MIAAGRAVGRVALALATTVAAVVLIVPAWLLRRLAGDPLRRRAAWRPLPRTGVRPERRRPTRSIRPRRSGGQRLRAGGVAVALGAAAVVATPLGDPWLGRSGPEREAFRLDPVELPVIPADAEVPPLREPVPDGIEEDLDYEAKVAVADDAWYDDYQATMGFFFSFSTGWMPDLPYRFADVASAHVNVEDGYRRSWQPPPCDCRRLSVWVYGGSTTFGLDQRDGHTIPSELARVAHDDGLVVDVSNRGIPGQLHWMEAERFAWDLTVDDPPDLVVFYDGINDTWATNTLNNQKTTDIPALIDPDLDSAWTGSERSSGDPPGGPPGARFVGRERGEQMTMPQAAETTVARYDRSRTISAAAAAEHGVVARYVWQPTRSSRPLVEGEPHSDTDGENWVRHREQLMRAALADDVIDVSDVFDDVDEPLFVDDAHHNETGARLVAEAIYANISDELRELAGGEAPR